MKCLLVKWFYQDIQLLWRQLVFLFCQFQPFLAKAIDDCLNVPCMLRSQVGCNPNIVHVLSILVSFDNWVKVLAQEALKNRHISAEALCNFLSCKCSASKFEGGRFHLPLVRHLQTMISLGAVDLAEKKPPCQVLCCFWQSADWLILWECWFFWDPQEDVVFRWVFSVQKRDLRTSKRVVL